MKKRKPKRSRRPDTTAPTVHASRRGRGRPFLIPGSIRIMVRLDKPTLAAVTKYRAGQEVIPNVSTAIRLLIQRGLAV